MRELVLGITVLLSVQLAFVSYSMLQEPVELAIAPFQTGPPTGSDELPWIKDLSTGDEVISEPPMVVSPTDSQNLKTARSAPNARTLQTMAHGRLAGRVPKPAFDRATSGATV